MPGLYDNTSTTYTVTASNVVTLYSVSTATAVITATTYSTNLLGLYGGEYAALPTNVQQLFSFFDNNGTVQFYLDPLTNSSTIAANTIYTPSYSTLNVFNGDNSTTQFQLSATPLNTASITVAVGGVIQVPGDSYNLVGDVVVFNEAPITGTDNVYVQFYTYEVAVQIPGPQGPPGPQGSTGTQGIPGVPGRDGSSVSILGSTSTQYGLPGWPSSYTGYPGDGYIVTSTGHLWVWAPPDWTDVGNITGPTGATGTAATIQIGTVTAGTTATVTNTGTVNAAVFNFVLPQGPKGDTGTAIISSLTNAVGQAILDPTSLRPSADSLFDVGALATPWRNLYIKNNFGWNGYVILPPTGDNTRFLRNDGVWAAGPGGGGSTATAGVSQIVAGSNIAISPVSGTGTVTINAVIPENTGVQQIVAGPNILVTPASGTGTVTISAVTTGVQQIVAGSNISITPGSGTGTVTINAVIPASTASVGVQQIVAGNGVGISPASGTGTVTISFVGTASTSSFYNGNSIRIGPFAAQNQLSNWKSTVIGYQAAGTLPSTNIGEDVVIGYNAGTTGTTRGSVLIGSQAQTNNHDQIAIGKNATIGSNAYADVQGNIVIGANSTASGRRSTVVGYNIESTGSWVTAIGYHNTLVEKWDQDGITTIGANGAYGIGGSLTPDEWVTSIGAIKNGTRGIEANAVHVGANTLPQGVIQAYESVSVGVNSTASFSSVAIGYTAVAGGYNTTHPGENIAIGTASRTTGSYSICIGPTTWNPSGSINTSTAANMKLGDRSILLNASGSLWPLPATTSSFFVKPIRRVTTIPSGFVQMYYNPTTGEIIYYQP